MIMTPPLHGLFGPLEYYMAQFPRIESKTGVSLSVIQVVGSEMWPLAPSTPGDNSI